MPASFEKKLLLGTTAFLQEKQQAAKPTVVYYAPHSVGVSASSFMMQK
jgi:hypothetical protein